MKYDLNPEFDKLLIKAKALDAKYGEALHKKELEQAYKYWIEAKQVFIYLEECGWKPYKGQLSWYND